MIQLPIVDTHCDLLSYLASVPGARADKVEDIACAVPFLKKGNVKLQILAIFTDVVPGSMDFASKQAAHFQEILATFSSDLQYATKDFLADLAQQEKIGVVTSIESASGLANERVPLQTAFDNLDKIIAQTGRVAYISLTHHKENRFGGGNYTEGIGLKDDGKRLLDYVAFKNIPIDLSHTSDLLAEGILNHIDQESLDIPILASHSNFRSIWNHKRNLTDEFVKEIIHRKGVIGVNFLRAFLDNDNPDRIYDHILYGLEKGAEDHICFGADYFYTVGFADIGREPFYFPNVENAGKYPDVLGNLSGRMSTEQLEKLAFKNAQNFFSRVWR
ncbi:Zn-dependent dipeptidase, microsomal dipeptidase [Belliella baltica DSM 15883]|uniref:Zn-dependent dipeptidase, microsomal dipeptidase n=1 Tax=Belliella baltica (strain DSM 15883 / CIP 108006 / LMG 21964 / BA134) TaxID=866536 RepID=I3Z2D9_BELBD|nr:Zn-dependent dipeptidase, microsomal dipeptidase [Belliella baltica DSM 15883]